MSFLDQFEEYDYPMYGYVRLPEVKVSDDVREEYSIDKNANNYEVLRQLTYHGFKTKIKVENKQPYIDRIKHELETIKKLGFVDYYLLVWNRINFCKKNGIAYGKGRGSCANSAVFYLIGVTFLDPVRYNLWFERFISEARAKKKEIDGVIYVDGSLCPDSDLDIDPTRHNEVVTQLHQEYPNRIAKISTFNTLKGKKLIGECCKVVGGFNEDEAKFVRKMIPVEAGFVRDLKDCYEGIKKDDSEEFEEEPIESFVKWVNEHKDIYNIALKLRGLIKNRGSHPSGYIVSYEPLEKHIPLEIAKAEETNEEEICGVFDMHTTALMAVKLDLLRLGTCSVIDRIVKLTGENEDEINIDSDPIIYDALQNFTLNYSIFQLEGYCALRCAQKVKPKKLGDLSAVLALARPGGLSFIDKYAENSCESVHPVVDEVLKDTRGICVYQETVMAMFNKIGFSLENGELIRRCISKKELDKVKEWKSKIYVKCKENNLPESLGDLIWKIVSDSAKYQFNAGHSYSYSALTAILIYLKFKYPREFFWSCLIESLNKPDVFDRIGKINHEMKVLGIQLLPPDLAKSSSTFTLEGNGIRFGLNAIKGVGKSVENILKFDRGGANRFEMFAHAKEAEIKINVLSALIMSGCMDSLLSGASRSSLTLQAQLWYLLKPKEWENCMKFGAECGYSLFKTFNKLRETKDGKGKLLISDSRFETINKTYQGKKRLYELNSQHPQLTSVWYENTLLGFSYSHKLKDIYLEHHPDLISISEIAEREDDDNVEFVAFIKETPKNTKSKKGNAYASFILTDESGEIKAMLFNNKKEDKIERLKRENGGELPDEDALVYVKGQKKGDALFISKMKNQHVKIETSWGKLKNKEEKVGVDESKF